MDTAEKKDDMVAKGLVSTKQQKFEAWKSGNPKAGGYTFIFPTFRQRAAGSITPRPREGGRAAARQGRRRQRARWKVRQPGPLTSDLSCTSIIYRHKPLERPVHICASLPVCAAVLSWEESEQWPPFVCCNCRSMTVRVLGALPRLFVADLGHFEPRHGEVRVLDDVSFVVTVGMGS